MKKDVYVIIGIAALVLSGALAAWWIYNKSNAGTENPQSTVEAVVRADMSLLLGDASPSIGPSMAKVQIVEFLDPECESCRAMHPYLKTILKDYEGKVRYTLRYMPFHANSVYVASLLEAAREQDKFWEALDLVFETQPEWGSHHAPKPELLPEILKTLKIDMPKLVAASKRPEMAERIERDKQDGAEVGVKATPTFFVNGRMLSELGDAPLRALIDEALKE